jgi:hypothetical protein
MSTELNTLPDLADVQHLQRSVEALRTAVERLEGLRDATIRQHCRDPKVNRSHLAAALGLSRSRLYGILEPPVITDPEDPAYGWADEAQAERAEELWDIAIHRWELSGREGDPEDFYPVELLHVSSR